MRVYLAQPRGFCAGVERAVEIVERALDRFGPPVYVRHEIVHNRRVVEDLRSKGAIFVEEVDEVPEGALTVFSAHGVSRKVERAAGLRGLEVIDATCPLVSRVHYEGRRYATAGYEVVLIGHAGHAEVEGTLGQINGRVHLVGNVAEAETLEVETPDRVAYVTQTTLSVEDTRGIIEILKRRFPDIQGPDTRDICYATQNRQQAVRELAGLVDLMLVLGARNSSNSNRLREIAEDMGVAAHLIDDAAALDPAWLDGVEAVGITAGASAPEILVDELIARLRALRPIDLVPHNGIVENVQFKLPSQVRDGAPVT